MKRAGSDAAASGEGLAGESSRTGPLGHAPFPSAPILASVWRGDEIESVHRGSWCLVDSSGRVLEEAGAIEHPFFTRSAIKCLQVLPLFESGAAERFAVTDEEVALAVSSHNAEDCHVRTAEGLLARIGLTAEDLGCGAQPPGDVPSRLALKERGGEAGRIHNNCSGKHAAFLALTKHLGADPARYLDFESESQVMVRAAVAEMCELDPMSLGRAVDGCSAPTFRMPLRSVAAAFARFTTPDGLAPERRAAAERVLAAVRKHPVLLAGRSKRLCTALVTASGGRLFPKIGAEAVYLIGVPGRDLGLAVKIDDGGLRGLHAVVVGLLRRFDLLSESEALTLERYAQRTLRNWDGIEIGRVTLH